MGYPRRPNEETTEPFVIFHDHAQLTADLETKLYEVAAGQKVRIERVSYVNPTGLAEDALNFFNIQVLKEGADVVANHSTETGEEGSIAADTFVELVLGDSDDRVLDAGEVLSVKFDESGTATLPAGRIVIEGHYL